MKTTEKLFLPRERLSNRIQRGSRETSAYICPRLKKLTSKAQKVLKHFLLCPQNGVYILVVDATYIKVYKMNHQNVDFLWIERDISQQIQRSSFLRVVGMGAGEQTKSVT